LEEAEGNPSLIFIDVCLKIIQPISLSDKFLGECLTFSACSPSVFITGELNIKNKPEAL